MAIGTFAIAAVMKKNGVEQVERAAPTNGWYMINITDLDDPDNEANQEIVSLSSPPPQTDPFGCAQEDNEGNACMVELSFSPSATTLPATVAEARTSSLTTVGSKAHSPEE